jgi:hypothetical protein
METKLGAIVGAVIVAALGMVIGFVLATFVIVNWVKLDAPSATVEMLEQ